MWVVVRLLTVQWPRAIVERPLEARGYSGCFLVCPLVARDARVSLDFDQLRVPAGVGSSAQLLGDAQQQGLVTAQLQLLRPHHHAADGKQRGEAVREQHEGHAVPLRAVAHAEAMPDAAELAAHDGLAAGSAKLRVHVPGSVCGRVVGSCAQEVALVALAGGGSSNASVCRCRRRG
jgi:hypothetical protein